MKKYLIPFLYTVLIILVGTFITSVLYYFNITGDISNKIILYITVISASIIGSYKFGKCTNKKGLISGLIYGFSLISMMVLISIISSINLKIQSSLYFSIILLISVIGSIIGKNRKEEVET